MDYIQEALQSHIEYMDEYFPLFENKESDSTNNYLAKIVSVLQNIVNKFLDAVNRFLKLDEKWIKDNYNKFENLVYDSMSIKSVPYWNITFSKIQLAINEALGYLKREPAQDIINAEDIEAALVQKYFKKYNDPKRKEASFIPTQGMKNFFKVGKPDDASMEPITITGWDIKPLCLDKMIPYVLDYPKKITPFIKSKMQAVQSDLKNIQRRIARTNTSSSIDATSRVKPKTDNQSNTEVKKTNESYYDIFDYMDILTEADENQNDNKPKVEVKKDNNTQNNNQDNKDDKNQSKTGIPKTENQKELLYYKSLLKIIQVLIASALTALEERYKSYMYVLKQILSAGSSK